MARAFASRVIAASLTDVWPIVRDFGGIGRWYAPVQRCTIDDGVSGATVGAVREIDFGGGIVVRERLMALSDVDHRLSYHVASGLDGFTAYASTVALHPVSDPTGTLIEWSADFELSDPAGSAAAIAAIEAAFRVGFEGIATLTAGSPAP